MSNTELKDRIITRVRESENPELLKEVFKLMEIEYEDIEVYKLSNEQKAGINAAKEEVRNGNVISDEKSNKEIDEWLKE